MLNMLHAIIFIDKTVKNESVFSPYCNFKQGMCILPLSIYIFLFYNKLTCLLCLPSDNI